MGSFLRSGTERPDTAPESLQRGIPAGAWAAFPQGFLSACFLFLCFSSAGFFHEGPFIHDKADMVGCPDFAEGVPDRDCEGDLFPFRCGDLCLGGDGAPFQCGSLVDDSDGTAHRGLAFFQSFPDSGAGGLLHDGAQDGGGQDGERAAPYVTGQVFFFYFPGGCPGHTDCNHDGLLSPRRGASVLIVQ